MVDEGKIQKEKQFDYFEKLEDKYKSIVIKDIKLIEKEKELNEAIKIVSEFVVKACDFYNNNKFIEDIYSGSIIPNDTEYKKVFGNNYVNLTFDFNKIPEKL